MISINVIGDLISGSYGNTPFSRTYEEDIYNQMVVLADQADQADTVEEYNGILAEFALLATEDLYKRTRIADIAGDLFLTRDSAGRYFIEYDTGDVIDIPLPESLVNRILDSYDANIDTTPLAKLWLRWLRNPILRKKSKEGKGEEFTKRFFEFIDMKYVHPRLRIEFMDEHGLSEELATQRATMYQVKITKEGLVNAFKVSKEILHKYDAETGEEVPRYQRTFNVDTGEIESEGLPEHVEDRLFEPAVWTSGDKFYCEGANGYSDPQYFIKVGCVHRLPSWDMVDTNDDHVCVPGLHVGGLKYIAWYTGEIHNVFIDPMHVGAIPNSEDGAIRCIQYFVHSSLVGVNGSMYHSSAYAAKTDEEWEEMKNEILEGNSKVVNQVNIL
mgnify:CR=1 FL=1|tara:strand:- start:178 stop:1335 length:1158 start_codon:yes stop_codon:yes gene_type:complete